MYHFIPTAAQRADRTFLFLQGIASPFFAKLARELSRRGHGVRRINLCFGDRLFWPLRADSYRGSLAGWRSYLADYLTRHSVTDIVLFGDCRPYHRVAIELAGPRQVQVHVFEEGYFRPNWITVEQGGVNGYSSLPCDPDLIRMRAAELPAVGDAAAVHGTMLRRASWDVAYNVGSTLGVGLYPLYRRHRPLHPLVEYAGWLRRLAGRRAAKRHAQAECDRILARPGGFYLAPLQLDSDYQIRTHSRFEDIGEFLGEVLGSFARHAPPEAMLLVKVHPLDNGLVDRSRQVSRLARKLGIAHRVSCIDGGHLPTLLKASRGVVLVNSTVGTSALDHGRPLIALGDAIYDLPGLTFQGPLDRFWSEATPPDAQLVEAFRRLIVHETQINGSYFCPVTMDRAVAGAAERVERVKPAIRSRPVAATSPVDLPAGGVAHPEPAE